MQIDGSVFLITGGASGLGAATARMVVGNGGKACSPISRKPRATRWRPNSAPPPDSSRPT